MPSVEDEFEVEIVDISELTEHPENYQEHPDDQLEELKTSVEEHGIYKNIVVANDYTILAGHGVTKGARLAGYDKIPVYVTPYEPFSIQAKKIMVADNETGNLAERDDRRLSELLKEINESEESDLKGTGYDQKMMANLAFVSRDKDEIEDMNEARHWAGMPEFERNEAPVKMIVNFDSKEKRAELMRKIGLNPEEAANVKTFSMWYPRKEKDDPSSLRFEPPENGANS